MKKIIIGLIRFYQATFSAAFLPSCRYQPTCSHYAIEAIERFGVIHGALLAVRRILRCHPWGGSGYDPVPQHKHSELG